MVKVVVEEGGGQDMAYALYVLARAGRAPVGDLKYLADTKIGQFGSPLARALFGVPGVSGVYLGHDFISVTKAEGEPGWPQVKPAVLGAIMEHYMSGAPLLAGGEAQDDADLDDEDEFFDEADAEVPEQGRVVCRPLFLCGIELLPEVVDGCAGEGNLPGAVGDWENTHCPQCNELLIERYSFKIRQYRLTASGACPKCAAKIPEKATRKCES